MRLRNTTRARRGSILIVVIGLLALFAVVGLSFVLYADAEATAARSARAARNADALPDPDIAANDFLRQLLFDAPNNTSMMLGHSFATSRFASGSNVPFTGAGIPSEQVTANGVPFNRRLLVNYSLGATLATPTFNFAQGNSVPFSKAVPWTYPDTNNFHLAWLNPATGKVEVPSFHRADVFGDLGPTNPKWTGIENSLLTLRPHPSIHPNFPKVPANADGTYTGDVCNLKFANLPTGQTNDSLWMYAGSPVQEWRGRRYVAMVAPLILDLSGCVNLSVAGNTRNGSTHGFGQWEINPAIVLGVANAAEVNQIINARTGGTVPYDHNKTTTPGTKGLINLGRNPSTTPMDYRAAPFYSRIDIDTLGGAMDGPPMLPAANGTTPFPTYPSRFEDSAATVAALDPHPSMFNPFQWQRGSTAPVNTPRGFGMDDLVKLASRYNDPKNRYNTAELAKAGVAPTSMAKADVRHLTTAFSVSQRWGRLPVNGGTAYVGPVDLNRPLPEYRLNTSNPLSSTNIVAAAQLDECNEEREHLAWDIFVRLLAASNLVDGTNVTYSPVTGHVAFGATPPTPAMKQLAQFAVNIVDYIDGDDVMTRFLWHADTDIVYGTELPKLVLNEAYCGLFNDPTDSPPAETGLPGMKVKAAQKEIRRKYWVELHNPLANDPTLPDGGASRLAPKVGDPAVNPYRIDILEENNPNTNPYFDFLNQDPSNAAKDPTAVANLTSRIQLTQFTNGSPKMGLTGDEPHLVQPAPMGTAGANQTYFVIGPKDQPSGNGAFPETYEQNQTLTFPDPTNAGQQNVLVSFTANEKATKANIDAAVLKTHTFILQRLANPYIVGAGNNPYVTLDFVERVPTRDRVLYTDRDERVKVDQNYSPDAGPTHGKCHPYASGFVGDGAAIKAWATQTSNNNKHSFCAKNDNLDNVNNGLAWLVHMDRELVNSTEILQTSIYSPGLLTKQFFNGALPAGNNYNHHNRSPNATLGNLLDTTFIRDTAGMPSGYKAFDVLTVGSRLPGIPLGGREPGLVNVNMMADQRIASAISDPQAGNTFDTAWSNTAWGAMMTSRGVTPSAAAVPFQPYSSTAPGATVDNTLLRSNVAGAGAPILFNTAPTNGNHDYFKSEPLRKVMNNTTTVTDGFLVIWTVGFFEVEGTNPSGPIIGKELYERVPGDMRSQFTAVVDRSMVTVNAVAATALGSKPAETKLTQDAHQGSTTLTVQGTAAGVYIDGNLVPLTGQRRVGLGDALTGTGDGEWVTVTSAVPSANPGQVTLTLGAPGVQYFHGAGTSFSNALLGAPTPAQVSNFNCADPNNRHIVPYYIRMQP